MPMMLRLRPLILVAFAAAALAALPAASRTGVLPPKPYTPVAITLPAASEDESFAKFRSQLGAVARDRIYAELERLVRPQGFFWDRDYNRHFDPRKPAVDNLAAALALERNNGSGWELLAGFAAEAAVEPVPSRPGVMCAPARPSFESTALARLLDTTYTERLDWAYPRADRTPVLALPQDGAATVDTLGLHFVRVLGIEGSDGELTPGRTQWAHVVIPDGRSGYVGPGSLMSLTAERLCYIKDLIAGWQIAGYLAGGN